VSIALSWDRVPSPLGTILAVTDAQALRALDFEDHAPRMRRLLQLQYPGYELQRGSDRLGVRSSLAAYFDGDLRAFDALPVATNGTPFQQQVWSQLRRIDPGTTISYGELAARVGVANGARAVGLANGSNPIAIAIPCHRVIGANGKLTGYGGGLERKAWLLRHESRELQFAGSHA
jgi:methylated-DNA-[protein]-cysteine S-methyltransferase